MAQDEVHGDVVAAGAGAVCERKLGFFGRIAVFFLQVISELRKVVTPTRKELFSYTGVVLVFVVIMMAIVSGFDFLFSLLVNFLFGDPNLGA